MSKPATVAAEPKEPTVAAKPTQATVAAEPYQPESEPFPLCSGFHSLDWRMGWLMDNESFVSQLDQYERKARSWGSEERELFAISAARHLYEFLQSQSRHRRPDPELVERLLGYHRQLARGRQSVEGSCVADLSSYFGALDTETLGAAPLAARPLWREAVARNPQAWVDARRYPKSLPRDIATYRASARLALARNLAHYEPTDRDGAQALLLEAEGIDTSGAKASGAKARDS
ncbi:MAG TPA: hypothetical protein VLC09_02580, partial [Polyangiaceae bacterium]|nr:hypothetical protein [Polyangiaceae bacterium]